MPDVPILYECPACHASCTATVTGLDDPATHLSPRTQQDLRAYQRPGEEDPVEALAAKMLREDAQKALAYATCPRCAKKNPAGVARERRSTAINLAFLAAIAAGAWFVWWIAIVPPALGLILLPFAIAAQRRSGQPAPWAKLAAGIALEIAMIAVAVIVRRAAPLVPVVAMVLTIVQGTGSDARWKEGAQKIRFEDA